MRNYLSEIQESRNWNEYYDAYKAAYVYILNDLWAFGKIGFAQQLHHTAIPDASGSIIESVNWAAYSQPSQKTLESFIPIFLEALKSEPQRIRSSRYLFFVTYGSPIDIMAVRQSLADYQNKIDFWCSSFEEIFSSGQLYATALGLAALFSSSKWKPPISKDENINSIADARTILIKMRQSVHDEILQGNSIVAQQISTALIDSSLILLGFRMNLKIEDIVDIIGDNPGMAACISLQRVISSGWQRESITYCESILALKQPKTNVYIVQSGDILSRVARQHFEMPFYAVWPFIKVLNPSIHNPDRIYPGQKIILPVL